jgi:hypothetical protein
MFDKLWRRKTVVALIDARVGEDHWKYAAV